MRRATGLLIVVVLVNAVNFSNFFNKKTTPNPAVYCKDKDEKYCKDVAKSGLSRSGKPEVKDLCAKSCNECCFDMYQEECKKCKRKGSARLRSVTTL
ncbi:hypothetical protein Aduo_015941 [Ancylostoma duodenale]